MKQDHTLATRVHSYRRADDAQALSQAVQEVFAEKSDSSTTNSDADFDLLQAFDDDTAKEALSALAKPNNAAITGLLSSTYFNAPLPINNQPATAATGVTFFGAFIALVLSCVLPLFVVAIVVLLFLSKATSSNKNKGRGR